MGIRTTAMAAALGTVFALVSPALPQASAAIQQASIVSDNPANWTPNVLDGSVKAIVQVGNTMIAGGLFNQIQGSGDTDPVITRPNIFAFDATTGVINNSFAPTVDGEVSALAVSADGLSVYLGGDFNTVNGTSSRKLARVSIATGQKVAGFNAGAISAKVNDITLSRGRLIIGGQFTKIKQITRTILASLNPATGALTEDVNVSFTGKHNGGTTAIVKFAVDPAGNRLMAIGNFTTVGGLDRHQVAMLDISGATATVADWRTTLYTSTCASVFDTYMRDLDISPDGSYVVISTTGAYRANSGCDVIARFEMGATGADVQSTWRDYTGGDTTYAVAVTGTAVYVGGHFRWMNNASAADTAGPGAVPREGIAALDPANGMPFSWDPGRERGVGVFDLLATPAGLWVGHDTDRVASEQRKRVAFFPLSSGTTPPPNITGSLPTDVYRLGGTDTVRALPRERRRPRAGVVGRRAQLARGLVDEPVTAAHHRRRGDDLSDQRRDRRHRAEHRDRQGAGHAVQRDPQRPGRCAGHAVEHPGRHRNADLGAAVLREPHRIHADAQHEHRRGLEAQQLHRADDRDDAFLRRHE